MADVAIVDKAFLSITTNMASFVDKTFLSTTIDLAVVDKKCLIYNVQSIMTEVATTAID
jgi:hypothetical protein